MTDDVKTPIKKGKGRKRTIIPVAQASKSNLTTLKFEDMVISNGKNMIRYFNRLRYLGVPTVKEIKKGGVVHANRDAIVRKLYDTFIKVSQGTSLISYFNGCVYYFKYLDSIGYTDDVFENEVMSQCIKYYNGQRKRGKEKTKSRTVRCFLAWLLILLNRSVDARKLPGVKNRESSSRLVAFNIETELKPISKALIHGFRGFVSHIKANTYPDVNPIFIEELFLIQSEKEGWTKRQISCKKRAFKDAMRPPRGITIRGSTLSSETLKMQNFANQAGRNALYVFYMLTGMNRNVLATVRIVDVHFKDIGNGRYIFDGEKSRAGYKNVDNALGFSKYTKELVESWLSVSKLLYQRLGHNVTQDLPLFPYFTTKNGSVLDFSFHGTHPEYINRLVEKLLGFTVNSTRFRKTKSDVLMRVTEDIMLVSLGLNNTVQTVARTYASGVKADHDNNLNAAFSAQMAIAKGQEIAEAISEAKVLHSDILSDYDVKQRLRKGEKLISTITPTGIRCRGATAEKLATEVKKLIKSGLDLSEDEHKCTDFLGCFDCESHLLIASEMDIWLMLSFFEQIEDLKEQVAINSTPKEKVFKVEALLRKTLERLKAKSPDNYNKAILKVKMGIYHPLYLNRASLKQFF